MMIFKKAIPRRTFLRGAGATIALPLLDAIPPVHYLMGLLLKARVNCGQYWWRNARTILFSPLSKS